MNTEDKIAEKDAEIARLNAAIKWYQGQAGQRIGEAARAGMAGASVQGAGEVPRLIELLNAIKPNFGDVGSRDVEVRSQRERIEEAIAILSATLARVPPLAPATVWFAVNRTSSMVFASEELARKYVSSFPASISGGMEVGSAPVIGVAQPAAPLPEQPGPSEANSALIEALTSIKEMTDADDPESYRGDDREGCLDAVFSAASDALAASPSPAPAQQQEPRIAVLEARLTAIAKWLEQNQSDVFQRGLWDVVSAITSASVETAAPGASIGDDPKFSTLVVAYANAPRGDESGRAFDALVKFLDQRGAQ